MYFPILKGKQNELIALRELSSVIDARLFKPVIEPVRENISPLKRTIQQLSDNRIVTTSCGKSLSWRLPWWGRCYKLHAR